MDVQNHQRPTGVWFLSIGLAAQNSDRFVPIVDSYTQGSDRTWKIRTLASLKKMLGHENVSPGVLLALLSIFICLITSQDDSMTGKIAETHKN